MSVLESDINKVASLKACNVIKKGSNTGIFLWILQNFQDTYSEDYQQTAAFESKNEFVQSIPIVQTVDKTYW